MHEFSSVSSSSHDSATLVAKLNEKSADGWDVVAIVPTGIDVTAFLSRSVGGATAPAPVAAPAAMAEQPAAAEMGMAAAAAASATEEPAGWAVAPDESAAPIAAATVIAGANDSAGAASPAAGAGAAAAGGASGTPAGWYHDPSGRYELRYWDGSQWSEHVARGGQQYTDPPVA